MLATKKKYFLTLNSGEADSDQLKYGHGGEERSGNIEFLAWFKKRIVVQNKSNLLLKTFCKTFKHYN
jgi:hypothetical protein